MVGEDYNIEDNIPVYDNYNFEDLDLQEFSKRYNIDMKIVLSAYKKII